MCIRDRLFCVDPLLKVMDSTTRFSCIHSIFEDKGVQPSTLALLLNDFETQHGRYTEKTMSGDDAMFSLEEVLKLEQIFKIRAVEALDSGDALRQYQGLNFLWMLGLSLIHIYSLLIDSWKYGCELLF